MPERSFTVIVNPHAGGGRAQQRGAALAAQLQASGCTADVITTTSLAHARQAACDSAAAGRITVACGGDGLLRGVAAGILAGQAPSSGRPRLGIVPAGRGNDFARTLGLPSDPRAIAEQLISAPPQLLDAIDVDGEIALGNVYVGFDSRSNELANSLRRSLGRFTYSYAAARVALTLPRLRIELRIDEQIEYSFDGQGVTVASSAYYGGGTLVAPGADPRDGVLDVICFAQTGRLARAAALLALVRGRHQRRSDVQRFAARRFVEISVTPELTAFSDGDPIAGTPLTARVLPGAIELIGAGKPLR